MNKSKKLFKEDAVLFYTTMAKDAESVFLLLKIYADKIDTLSKFDQFEYVNYLENKFISERFYFDYSEYSKEWIERTVQILIIYAFFGATTVWLNHRFNVILAVVVGM